MSGNVTIRYYCRENAFLLSAGALALIVVNIFDLILPLVVRQFIDGFENRTATSLALQCAVAYVAIAVVQAVCRLVWRITLARAGVGVARDTRSILAQSVLTTIPAAIDALVKGRHPSRPKVNSGEVIALAHSDAESLGRAFDIGIVILIDAFFSLVFVPVVLIWLDPELALWTLAPMPFISFLVLAIDKRIRKAYADTQQKLSSMSSFGENAIARARSIKVLGAEGRFVERFGARSGEYLVAGQHLNTVESIFGPTLELFVCASVVLLLVVGGGDVIAGTLSLGTFLAFQKYLEKLQWPMQAVALAFTTYKKSRISSERIQSYLDLPFPDRVTNRGGDKTAAANQVHPLLQISNLKVDLGEHAVADGAESSFAVKDGERVAIVGPVGSGKSTVLSTLVGLSPIGSGEIYLDGVSIVELTALDLHHQISMVPQEAFLFGLSLRENLLFGAPSNRRGSDSVPSDEELSSVLGEACLLEEVQQLPSGLDTILGERGITLSGGQRQRLALARALLRNPRVLLLDNALAAVDAATERRIIENLSQRSLAIIFVTQRLSSVQLMDRVLVVVSDGVAREVAKELAAGGDYPADEHSTWYREFVRVQRVENEFEHYVERLD